ncbi:MAG: GGDEF domain-containing protein [Firmicutes bacterium]|nr:GGDEF domain-containing protein [Bacillota bacterium]
MKKLILLVCENYCSEFCKAAEHEQYEDVIVRAFPSLCESKGNKVSVQQLFQQAEYHQNQVALVCSSSCDVMQYKHLLPEGYKLHRSVSCFSHLIHRQFSDYIIENGGYLISSGWLSDWQSRLREAGFEQDIARNFYGEFAKELVFLDAGIDNKAQHKLQDLSNYLNIPYRVIQIDLEMVSVYLRSIVLEWRLHCIKTESKAEMNDLRRQLAEYAAVLKVMEQISNSDNQREVIGKIKEVFLFLFGAQTCDYIEKDKIKNAQDHEFQVGVLNDDMHYWLNSCKNGFYIKIKYNDELFGILKVGDFLFPQHFDDYLNLSIALVNVSALVLSNVKKYELLIQSRNEAEYNSHHDTMTGLYNRTYYNKFLTEAVVEYPVTAFLCDLDGLKVINDSLGHAEGDKLITLAASLLKASTRNADFIARIGGDEFVIIIQKCDKYQAEEFKGRICNAIVNNNINSKLQLGISVGYSVGESDTSLEELIKKADNRMYQNKAKKKQSQR